MKERMRLGPGPFRRISEEYGRPDKVLSDLHIILDNGPSPSSCPLGVWTGAERQDLPSSFHRASVQLPSGHPTRPGKTRVGKPQTPTPRGPNDYPFPRGFRGVLFALSLTISCDVTATDKNGGERA